MRAPTARDAAGGLRIDLVEASASLGDLGTFLPLAVGLVVINGLDPVATFGVAGLVFIISGLFYRVPVPVQPMKAAAAIAIATHASPATIAAASILLGAVTLLLAATRAVDLVIRLFSKPVIRGLQLGVGLLLILSSLTFIEPAAGSALVPTMVAAGLVLVLLASEGRRVPVALIAVLGAVVWSLSQGGHVPVPSPRLPYLHLPSTRLFWGAFTALVLPQIPLTLGNAVASTASLEREYYADAAKRVTPSRLCLTGGVANLIAGVLGGMPLCHGSGGLSAYRRLGARTGGCNLFIGSCLLGAGAIFGRSAVPLFALIPGAVLGGLLAYTGLRHALLVRDLRGWPLAVALLMGAVGAATHDLAISMAFGIILTGLIAIVRSRRRVAT
ncbi:MAG TPA: putative sulfate/molybdate transporter [Actinomycetota bacterium]|nr:putative sulfate/molybdate transporter [Actinomycetota bacterium]